MIIHALSCLIIISLSQYLSKNNCDKPIHNFNSIKRSVPSQFNQLQVCNNDDNWYPWSEWPVYIYRERVTKLGISWLNYTSFNDIGIETNASN